MYPDDEEGPSSGATSSKNSPEPKTRNSSPQCLQKNETTRKTSSQNNIPVISPQSLETDKTSDETSSSKTTIPLISVQNPPETENSQTNVVKIPVSKLETDNWEKTSISQTNTSLQSAASDKTSTSDDGEVGVKPGAENIIYIPITHHDDPPVCPPGDSYGLCVYADHTSPAASPTKSSTRRLNLEYKSSPTRLPTVVENLIQDRQRSPTRESATQTPSPQTPIPQTPSPQTPSPSTETDPTVIYIPSPVHKPTHSPVHSDTADIHVPLVPPVTPKTKSPRKHRSSSRQERQKEIKKTLEFLRDEMAYLIKMDIVVLDEILNIKEDLADLKWTCKNEEPKYENVHQEDSNAQSCQGRCHRNSSSSQSSVPPPVTSSSSNIDCGCRCTPKHSSPSWGVHERLNVNNNNSPYSTPRGGVSMITPSSGFSMNCSAYSCTDNTPSITDYIPPPGISVINKNNPPLSPTPGLNRQLFNKDFMTLSATSSPNKSCYARLCKYGLNNNSPATSSRSLSHSPMRRVAHGTSSLSTWSPSPQIRTPSCTHCTDLLGTPTSSPRTPVSNRRPDRPRMGLISGLHSPHKGTCFSCDSGIFEAILDGPETTL